MFYDHLFNLIVESASQWPLRHLQILQHVITAELSNREKRNLRTPEAEGQPIGEGTAGGELKAT